MSNRCGVIPLLRIMHIHFISIGGAVMHNLALALHNKGHRITGSDDEIYEPAKSRLAAKGILPLQNGWFTENVHTGIDAIILGMHARKDNPELLRAQQLGLRIYSFPEYIYEQTKNKKRIVVGGSHGKTTTTAMIMHVLKYHQLQFDYLVGSIIEGFDTMVGLNESSTIAVFEGDEYLSSALDLRPKFHLYHPHVGIITGIAWDHINVFPTYENYKEQFSIFMKQLSPDGTLIYCKADKDLEELVAQTTLQSKVIGYDAPQFEVINGETFWQVNADLRIKLQIFGKHNLQNMMAAKYACAEVGITEQQFAEALATFKGTAKRLELLKETPTSVIYRDFAHAPSKLKATIEAVRSLFPERKLVAAYELHTYSSLNKGFLSHYAQTMDAADIKAVLYSKHALEMKKMPMLDEAEVKSGFGGNVEVFTDKNELKKFLEKHYTSHNNLLLMSSGTFDGMNMEF